MENQDIDLVGQTVGNMFYKVGIVDKDGKLTNQFVANASTNRIDIPEQFLSGSGSTGGSTGGNTGGTTGGGTSQSQVTQLPSTLNLFSGSAVGDIKLSGPSANYDNVQDGLLITLGDPASEVEDDKSGYVHAYLSLKPIKIPKEKLIVNSSFDISDQLSQYIGQVVSAQFFNPEKMAWNYLPGPFYILSFDGTTIKVLPNTTLSMNLNATIKTDGGRGSDPGFGAGFYDSLQISVIKVNTYKN